VPAIGEIVRVGGRLFVEDGYRVYAISAATGRRIWTSQRADRGGILALAATSSAVYIGGDLAHVGDVHRGQVAALDPRTGRLLPWRAPALALSRGSPPDVTALAVLPPRLYLGGSFLSVGRAPRKNGVAAVGLRNGALSRFAPRKSIWNLSAMAVASRGRLVLIGGREGGGVFDAVTGAERTLASGVVSRAGAISVRGSIAYLGGNVQTPIGGHNLLAVNLRSGMMQPWRPRLARYVSVGPIALSGDRALVGGQFCSTLGG